MAYPQGVECVRFCSETMNGRRLCDAETSFGGSPSCLKRELFHDESLLKPPFTNDIMKDLIKECEIPVCLHACFVEDSYC